MGIGEHTEQPITQPPRIARRRPGKQAPEALGRRLLEIVVYDKDRRIGGTLTLDDLAETVGDWKMPEFKLACSYAASQGWLIVQDDVLTLTTAGLGFRRQLTEVVGSFAMMSVGRSWKRWETITARSPVS